jgi:hypothetical protein
VSELEAVYHHRRCQSVPTIFGDLPSMKFGYPAQVRIRKDDAEIVRYLITIDMPFSGHLLAQKAQHRRFEIGERRMTPIVRDVLVIRPRSRSIGSRCGQ